MKDRRSNILFLVTVYIAATMMFVAAMAARAALQPFPSRGSVADVAISGPNGVLDCDKVFKDGNCCVALHCAVAIASGAATPAFRSSSSKAVAEAPESLLSRAIGRLERPPRQTFHLNTHSLIG